jgi:hypothetical protein
VTVHNGVFERDGQWWLKVKTATGSDAHATTPDLGPFGSEDLADAVASYVFARWIAEGQLATTQEAIAAVTP